MKRTIKLISICLATIVMVVAVLPLTAFAAESKTTSNSKTFDVGNYTIHNMEDGSGYVPGNGNKVSVFFSGHTFVYYQY